MIQKDDNDNGNGRNDNNEIIFEQTKNQAIFYWCKQNQMAPC